MSATMMDIAEWAHSLDYEHIPERVREKARLQTLSVLAAIHAGARHEIGTAVHQAVEAWAGQGPGTIIPSGKKVDVLSAAYANAALSVSLDYDDYLLFGHTGHSAVCASLAMAEREGRTLKDQITAQVIANEIEGRLGAGVLLGPHNGQGWSHIHLAGAAAAAAKLMGLNAEQTGHAIGISLYQPTYVLWPGFMGPDSKATTSATPTVTGIQAAILASKGATGPLDVIEHPQGYLARLSYSPTPFFISGFGKAWVTDTLAYKIYPGCAYIDTTVDAVLKIREDFREETGEDLDPEDVSEVLVEATILTEEMDKLSRTGGSFDPLNPVSINFSIPGNVAISLLKGRLCAEDLSKKSLKENAEAILKVSEKVVLRHDWTLTLKMVEAMDRVLKLQQIMSEIRLKDMIGFRIRAREQYKSSLGISLADLRKIWSQVPDFKGQIWKGARRRLSGGSEKKGRKGFDLGACPLEKFTMPFTARVTITTRNGRKFTWLQDIPWGGPGHPLDKTKEFVLNKYLREARGNLEEKKVNELLKSADALESKLSLDTMIDLCCRE